MRYLHELPAEAGFLHPLPLDGCPVALNSLNRVNILALGDVGTTMLIGLRLLGSDVISELGICDIRRENVERLEMEINQIGYPFGQQELPPVRIVEEPELFDADVVIFCASRGIPPVEKKPQKDGVSAAKNIEPAGEPVDKPAGESVPDVRMAQLEANREIIRHYAQLAREAAYPGLVCVVSDPVDNLAAAFLDASGLKPWQIQGYGLGVMNLRALYYAKKCANAAQLRGEDLRAAAFARYETEGRAFGPHGQDLVIANSLASYDDALSRELTGLTVRANLRVRDLGFKPYIAPALSSAALSILLTIRGQWHYGSVYLGEEGRGAFLGVRNRLTAGGFEYEDPALPDELYERIRTAYRNLCAIR